MYQLLPKPPIGKSSCVKQVMQNKFIPFDPDNKDYQEYLKWLAEGNTPEPAEGA